MCLGEAPFHKDVGIEVGLHTFLTSALMKVGGHFHAPDTLTGKRATGKY
jgi:hypothetical protein